MKRKIEDEINIEEPVKGSSLKPGPSQGPGGMGVGTLDPFDMVPETRDEQASILRA